MASLRLKSEVDAGRIMPNIRKVPSLWSVKVASSQDFFLLWLHRPKICSKSLSIFSVGENAKENDLAYFLRMKKLSEIKLPLKSYGQFYYLSKKHAYHET